MVRLPRARNAGAMTHCRRINIESRLCRHRCTNEKRAWAQWQCLLFKLQLLNIWVTPSSPHRSSFLCWKFVKCQEVLTGAIKMEESMAMPGKAIQVCLVCGHIMQLTHYYWWAEENIAQYFSLSHWWLVKWHGIYSDRKLSASGGLFLRDHSVVFKWTGDFPSR